MADFRFDSLNSTWAEAIRIGEWSKIFAKQLQPLNELFSMQVRSDWADIFDLQRSFRTLSRAQDFARPDIAPTYYSSELREPGSYFERHEVVVESFRELNTAIANLTEKHPKLPLVWRGAQNASWGMHSSLYRHLMKQNRVVSPEKKPSRAQAYPDENQMVQAEREILRLSREDWRFDGVSALEIFARIQHVGGPTRLLDVSQNPYVATWFAVEASDLNNSKDARLFALATQPASSDQLEILPSRVVLSSNTEDASVPFWHRYETNIARQTLDWGTGARRWLWVPPAYDPRMLAQNAGFLLDGVPMTSAKTAAYFRKGAESGAGTWQRSDLLAASSIYAKTYDPSRKVRSNRQNFAPTFSFRITAEAKRDIRTVLETRFGYRSSSIYPDVAGLAQALAKVHF